MYKNPLPKLPKGLEDPAIIEQVGDWLTARQAALRPEGDIGVAKVEWTEQMEQALRDVMRRGHLLQGLDQIKKELDKELKGLQAVAKKQGTGLGFRLSRFLLLSADGSDRFYRQAESIFAEHKERLAGAVLSADSAVLGQAFSKKQQPVKALLIKDRKCLEAFLTAASRT